MVVNNWINHFSREALDVHKWDRCIENADNSSPYALHDYLDALTPAWEGLVWGDYEYVMPLPKRKKYFIQYLYQPFIVPHLGVYGRGMSTEIINSFINTIPKKYKRIDINLNPSSIPNQYAGKLIMKKNFILDINHEYEEIKNNYHSNITRNLKKAAQHNCQTLRNIDPIIPFEMAERFLRPRGIFDCERKIEFVELMKKWMATGKAETYGIRHEETIVSSAIFLMHKNRAYYLIGSNSPTAKSIGASPALLDSFICDHAGNNLILDFEGTDVPSLAQFYQGFGSKIEYYAWLRINKLPKSIAWLKPLY